MLRNEIGYITPQCLLLGSRHICFYLIKGDAYALLGGGVPWEVANLEAQLARFQVDRHRLRYLVISHAHHDHCGAVPYLVQRYPWLNVIASDYAAHLLNKEHPVRLMRDLNHQTMASLHQPEQHSGISLRFEPIPVAIRAGDGDQLELGGGLTLQFYLTPGHSRCSLTTYIPELGALFPADAVPIPENDDDKLIVTANHDYVEYLHSLEKLMPLKIRWVGYEHGGVLAGEAAETIIFRGLTATSQQRQRIVDRYAELNDLNRLVEEVAEKYHSLPLFRLIPYEVLQAIIERMIRSALGLV
jgi:2-aminobenzoylacetyl-CoA thioesterase